MVVGVSETGNLCRLALHCRANLADASDVAGHRNKSINLTECLPSEALCVFRQINPAWQQNSAMDRTAPKIDRAIAIETDPPESPCASGAGRILASRSGQSQTQTSWEIDAPSIAVQRDRFYENIAFAH